MRPTHTRIVNGESQQPATSWDRFRHVGGQVLIGFGTAVLLVAGLAKLLHVRQVVGPLEAEGLAGRIGMIAALELLSAAAFALPVTRRLGLLLVTAFLGGAVATHLQHMLNPAPPAVILGICWMGAWFCEPSLFAHTTYRQEAR